MKDFETLVTGAFYVALVLTIAGIVGLSIIVYKVLSSPTVQSWLGY